MHTELQTIQVPEELSDIDRLIYLVRISDRAENLTREGLWKIHEEGSWGERFSSWAEFVESPDGLNKSQSWASKHLAIHKHYTLTAGLSPEKLEGAATESLYLAKELPGTPEEQLAMARTLSRRELKETLGDGTNHAHEPETITWCKTCHIRIHDDAK